jgi:hypothetical protein
LVVSKEWIFIEFDGSKVLSLQLFPHVYGFVEREDWSDPRHPGDAYDHGSAPLLELVWGRSRGEVIGPGDPVRHVSSSEWRSHAVCVLEFTHF